MYQHSYCYEPFNKLIREGLKVFLFHFVLASVNSAFANN